MADQRLTDKGTMVSIDDADLIHIVDVSDTSSNAAGTSKKSLWSLIKSTLKTYFDTLYLSIANFLEENLIGTAVEDITWTGTEDLDLDTFSSGRYILTGNTTITTSNTPSVGESKVINLMIASTVAETLTLPVSWVVIGEYVNDGTENYFSIIFSNWAVEGNVVVCYINQA